MFRTQKSRIILRIVVAILAYHALMLALISKFGVQSWDGTEALYGWDAVGLMVPLYLALYSIVGVAILIIWGFVRWARKGE